MSMTSASRAGRTNRLADATSPYLLQHARNPVDWYPWGPEALDRARAEDKPIFLSIGYSACHWCHVMAHESFENEEVAGILNERFISIKVDREERPDLDEIYMNATLLYNNGQGGWPMSVFLTPERKPFFAGTYFPPASRYGRPGFADILRTIAQMWNEERSRLLAGADALTDAIRRMASAPHGDSIPGPEAVARAVLMHTQTFDRQAGGQLSGATNKFPPSMAMQLMMLHHWRLARLGRAGSDILPLVELTLDRMAAGGIYDQLAGGICRYSTDAEWLVPHFEKMLYDQALVSGAYLDAWRLTKKPLYARIAREIFDFCLAEMRSPDGAFYSAFDADSDGLEGKYYVWTLDEIRRELGESDAALFAAYYDVTEDGNWDEVHGHAPEGPKNILHVPRPAVVVAKLHGVSEDDLERSLASSRRKLLNTRRRRTPPGLDDKILTSWNGLLIASLARAACVLDEPRYRDAAVQAAEFILSRLSKDGRLLRTCRAGQAHTGGFLDDYAFFIEATLNLYEATLDPAWLDHALRLTDETMRRFHDPAGGGFFFTADDAEATLVRSKDAGDSAVPGGNSVHAMNLLRLAAIFDRPDLKGAAESTLRALAARIEQSPLGADRLLAAVDFYHHPPTEIVLVGPRQEPAMHELLKTAHGIYLPRTVIVHAEGTANDGLVARSPLLKNRLPIDDRPTAYVCEGQVCMQPVKGSFELADLLNKRQERR